MTILQAVDNFISNLELTKQESEEASKQHVNLREGLAKRLELDPEYGAFLTGSYARKTAIRPLKDIDIFCTMLPTEELAPSTHEPQDALDAVKKALDDEYPGKAAEPQNRSVNIEFSGTGIAYDVVPAFVDGEETDEVFLIPDIRADKWIKSNPRIHREKSVAANEKSGLFLKPLTKAVKHWNRKFSESERLKSFHIEIMAWDVLIEKPENRLEGLITLYEGLSTRVLSETKDPAELGPALDRDMTWSERSAASKRFTEAAQVLKDAKELSGKGETEAAHYKLYALFGDPYPEKGKPKAKASSSSGPTLVLPSAPDASGVRHG